MPELPDLTVYVDAINERLEGSELKKMHITSPFLLRTVEPKVEDLEGRKFIRCSRLAKQLVFELEDEYFFVIHLMISGRLQWAEEFKAPPKRNGLAAFRFDKGTITFTEASKKKRASLRLVQGEDGLAELNPGGLEVLGVDKAEFAERLAETNHTLKRALTDQRVFAGIGNAYSDEILHKAQLPPLLLTSKTTDEQLRRLFHLHIKSGYPDYLRLALPVR